MPFQAHATRGATEIQPPVPFLFKRRRPSSWNTCTTGAPSSSGRRRLRPVHQDRALSSTFLSDKSIRFQQLYIQIFEFRPLEFLKKLSPSPSYRFPCSQLAAPSEKARVKDHVGNIPKSGGAEQKIPNSPSSNIEEARPTNPESCAPAQLRLEWHRIAEPEGRPRELANL